MEATVTSKGQITVPKHIRNTLNIQNGDKIIFEEIDAGAYIIKPKKTDVSHLKAIINYHGNPISIEQMQDAIELNGE